MSDKDRVLKNYKSLQFFYLIAAIGFLALSLFLNSIDAIVDIMFFITFSIAGFFLVGKLFSSNNRYFSHTRDYSKMGANIKNYGPSGLISVIGVGLSIIVFLVSFFLFSKFWLSSLYLSMSVSCFYNFLYSIKHIALLQKRDEIIIV